MHDAVILGAGVAGSAAALALARHQRDVLLVDRNDPAKAPSQPAWIGKRATDALETLGVAKAVGDITPIRTVHFHSADLAQETETTFDDPPAGTIDLKHLRAALLNAAKSAGATVRFGKAVTAVQPEETCVRLHVADRPDDDLAGKLALLALGCQPGSAALIPTPVHRPPPESYRVRIRVPAGVGSELTKPAGRMHVVLDVGIGGLGFFWVHGDALILDVSGGDRPTAVTDAVMRLAQSLVSVKLATDAVVRAAKKPRVFTSPAGEALEADTHVIKRGLIIGDAGGFIGAASHEGLFPALQSAMIAAEVVHEALDAAEPQDQLHDFENRWRMSFAASLQPLDSDMRFLQPLVFSNAAIAAKVARAVLGCPD